MAEKPQDPDWKIPREHSGAQHRDTVELSLLSYLGWWSPSRAMQRALSLLVPLNSCRQVSTVPLRALPQDLVASKKGMRRCWGSFRKAKSIYRKVI